MKNYSVRINIKTVVIISLIGALNGCTGLMVTDEMIRGIHKEMDINNDGYITYQEYLQSGSKREVLKEAKKKGMSVDEYQKWDFNRADANRDRKITPQELIDLARKEL